MVFRSATRAFGLAVYTATFLQAQSEIRHPDADNLRDPPGTRYLSRSDSVTSVSDLMVLARRLRALRARPVGTAEFGRIYDVSARHGIVAVADQGFYEVTLLDTATWTPSVFGQQGSGPLDFRTLVAVDVQAANRLAVYDAVLGLKTLAIDERSSPRLLAVVPPRVSALSACIRRSTPVLVAPSGLMPGVVASDATVEPLLIEIDSAGEPIRRFGDSYRSSSALTRRVMSGAAMGCSATGEVVVGYVSLPFVRVYGENGQLRHTIRIRDFGQAWSIERRDANGRAAIGIDPGTRDLSQARRVVEVGPGVFAVQVVTLRAGRRSLDTVRLDTYLVAAKTGEGVYVGDHLPYLASADGIPTVGFLDDPEPALVRLVPR